MDKIQPGKFVELTYDLYVVNADGSEEIVHNVDADNPEKIVYGVTPGVIKPLEDALNGLEQGADFSVNVPAKDGFPFNPDDVVELDKNIFIVDGKFDTKMIFPGAMVPMMTGDGYRINGKVLEISDSKVKMDFNHPLVGKDLLFKGKILLVRDATPEDLHPSCGGCGGGCGESGCGEGGSCGCGGCN
ncbi:MAG: FKBP-type peptidyl-prolyl cis-trans isomerase [Lachnoclostridium sp.]|nr:FKBP-type peptidyl-prolyl cis-trans isomerase [Lachnoclostridium sp.]